MGQKRGEVHEHLELHDAKAQKGTIKGYLIKELFKPTGFRPLELYFCTI
jgi:hypothetical protein